MKHDTHDFDAVEEWLGVDLDADQRAALVRFEEWLGDEAVAAGGIGRGERDRLYDRHILDSLAFQRRMPEVTGTAVDIGGGVGLPSIPLAIVLPHVEFTLVDRSRRRTDLAARAIRILGVQNVAVRSEDVSNIDPVFDVALFRASLPIPEAVASLPGCVVPSGRGLLAVSRKHDAPSIPNAPSGTTFGLSREGDRILESPFWLLEMRLR